MSVQVDLEITSDGTKLLVLGSVTLEYSKPIHICKRGRDLYVHLKDVEKAKGNKLDLATIVEAEVARFETMAEEKSPNKWRLGLVTAKGFVVNGKVKELSLTKK